MSTLNVSGRNLPNSFFVLLLLSGSYIVVMLPGILKLPFFIFTVPLKYFILFYSLFLVAKGILGNKSAVFSPVTKLVPFVLFWVIYSVRLFLDLYVFDVTHAVFPTEFDYLEAIVFCIIPCFGICFARGIDYDWVLKWSFVFFLIASCLSFFISLNLATDEVQSSSGRYEGTQGLNSIAYGHNGASLALMATVLFFKRRMNLLLKLLFIGAFCIGLFTIYLAGSRSPLLALAVCLIVYNIINKGAIKGAVIITLISLPFILFFDTLLEFLDQFGGVFIYRVLAAINEGQTAGRDSIYIEGLKEFFNSPIWGSAFVLQGNRATGIYPHNLLLESLIATGIIGGMLFFYWFFRGIKISWTLIKENSSYIWIALLFLQQAIFAMFSTAIYTNSKFWHLGVILICVFYSKRDRYLPPSS